MAHLFIDDGSPEAMEYNNNYIYFDENDPESLRQVLKIAKQLMDETTIKNKPNLNCSPNADFKNTTVSSS